MADQEMIDLLREICENTLLAESDRIAKRQRVAEEDRRRRLEAIEDLIRGGGWSAARRAVAELIKRYPDAPEGRQAHDRVEQAAARAEEQDLRNTTARIEELMSIGAWDRALGLAEELVGKHPTSVKARQLLDRVQRERRLFRQEHVRRQVMDIERAVERHRYREALSLAAGFLESYGETQEAGNLRTQMAQLRENAEVEERKQLEEEIKDLVHRRSFGEALDLAGKVIDTYPTSPQAKALREQLPKIREAAKQFADEQDELRSRVHQ
jgi:outer membrane protein assembly factor BamD (BamD/ComL family)